MKIRTVLGDIEDNQIGVTLSHEHICCYSDYLYQMAGNRYLDKDRLCTVSVKYLKELKERYGLDTFVDCTPVNIGRDIELLKKISKLSGVHIICSTGFYYTEEPLLCNLDIEYIVDHIIFDANRVNAGVIKCAVEAEHISSFDEKVLRASARAQLQLHLPIVLHTNAFNKNGAKSLEILLNEGVNPRAITVGHLSDTDDMEYIKGLAEQGVFIGLDRLYENCTEEYISRMTNIITKLCGLGYENKILLSHDTLFFNGFEVEPELIHKPRFSYCFKYILPQLSHELVEKIMKKNPEIMLRGGR